MKVDGKNYIVEDSFDKCIFLPDCWVSQPNKYSAQKGCWFGREEVMGLYKLPEHLDLDKYSLLERICEAHWYEFCILEYPSKVKWKELLDDISKL